MPIYLSTVEENRSTEPQRAKIAQCITEVHVDVTGAPIQFVNAFFNEQADREAGFSALPVGKIIHINGNIRSGRSERAKADMIRRITQGTVDALGCDWDEVSVKLHTGDASHGMEGGQILPAPGSPEEEAWKQIGQIQRK
ncbi:MAG: tautomerase family protein [Chloroflexota bacterium]